MMIILAKWNFLLRVFNKFRKFIIQRKEKQGKRSCLLSSIKYHKLLSRFPLVVKNYFLLGNLSVEIFLFIIVWTFALRILEDKESFHNDKNYYFSILPLRWFFSFFKKRLQFFFSLASHFSRLFLFFFVYFLSSSSSSFYRLVLYSILSLCFSHSWYLKNKLYSSYFLVTVKSFALSSLVC